MSKKKKNPDSSGLLLLLGGGVLLYMWWQSQSTATASTSSTAGTVGAGALPSDAAYVGNVGTGGTWNTIVGPAYVYFSPSTQMYYQSQAAPSAAQVTAGAVAFNPQGVLAGSGTAVNSSASTSGSGTSSTPSTSSGMSLAAIYSAMLNASKNDAQFIAQGSMLTPYQWNVYLGNVDPTPPQAGITWPPDPSDMLPPGTDLTVPISATAYWAAVSPFLSAKYGMSGLRGMGGLGRTPQSVYFNNRYGGWAV